MKKFLMVSIMTVSCLSVADIALAAESSSCHFHGNKAAAPDTVASCAMRRKEILIEKGKIDKSWQPIQQDKLEQIDGKKGKEWRVTFKNPNSKDEVKGALYMFFTPTGNFIAANFTGK